MSFQPNVSLKVREAQIKSATLKFCRKIRFSRQLLQVKYFQKLVDSCSMCGRVKNYQLGLSGVAHLKRYFVGKVKKKKKVESVAERWPHSA